MKYIIPKAILVLSAAVILLVGVRQASADTAGELRSECAVLGIDPDLATNRQHMALGECLGYVQGFTEALVSYLLALPGADPPGIYSYEVASGVTNIQGAQAFLRYMDAHPSRESEPAAKVLRDALGTAGLLLEIRVTPLPANRDSTPASKPTAKGTKRPV